MLTSFWKTLVFLGALLFQDTYAQQYLGDFIPNVTYPGVPGSELAYFRVKDPAGKNNNLTLVNYYSLGSNGKRLVPSKIKRAVIIIHGLNRDPGTYMSNMLSALSQEKSDSNINFDSVAIMAPSFPNGDDKNVSYPYWDYPPGAKKKASGGAQSWTNLLVWKGSQWAGGGTNQYPTKSTTVSSYEVLDQLIQYFADKSTFPNINQIVVAGHSLGGQTVQRYATVGKPLSTIGVSTPVTYWIANPNSLVWLNSSRPLSTSGCTDYDEWRDGLSAYADYPSVYNTDLVASGSAAVLANYQTKNKAYARGTQDMGDDSSGCAPFTTGNNRHERFYYFINWWTPTCEAPTSTSGHCDTVDLIPMGHDGGGMMASSAGRARLFTDNFYGNGAKAYDFGYPRIQSNVDDPFPDPAYNETTASEDTTVYAGNMTFAGCYTDSSARTLSTMIYDSTSNTIEKCTTACSAAGYSIAGMEYGSQCWCSNTLGPYTQKTLDIGCSQACAGNSSQTCGNSNRLSVYSNGTPVQGSAPSNPETVGNYFYAGCHTEATSGRALSGPSTSDGQNMTLEKCATFCNGYKYFGIEYSAECYCGSYFGTGSAVAADSSCTMLCTGNSLELCGGPGALSVYQLDSDAPVSTIIQGSTTAGSAPTNTNTAGAIPSSSLCPATNGQDIADSNNVTYTIGCSSDTSIGSYSSAQASNSYFDCMNACDSAVSSGCVAWTYVGGTYGSGSGTCYLKNSQGSFTSAASNLVSGFKSSSETVVTTTTTSSAAPVATTYANGATPVVGGVTYSIETDTTYSGTLVTLSKKRATTVVGDCLRICAASSSCVATAFDGDSSTCTYYSAFDKNSKSTDVGTTFATVQARGSATTTSSSSTGVPSASLCPSTNGQTVSGYSVSCSSDTNIGSYTNKQAVNSYLECMSACDSEASTGCVAWTYVGGTYGQGAGTCWLKNGKGDFTSAGTNFISGMAASSKSSSSSSSSAQSTSATSSTGSLVSSSSTTSASSSATASSNLCPGVDSQDITDSNNKVYTIRCSSDTTVGSFTNTQAANSYAECMTACDSTTGCVAFTYVGGTNGNGAGTCWLKNDRGSASSAGSNFVAGFLKNVVASSSSSVSSTTLSSSTVSSSVTTSAASSSITSSATTTTVSSSTVSSSSATTSSGVPSASLCPSANGQIVTDSNGNQYNVTCSADNSVGSYTNAQASASYLDCMTACDSAASTGCQGFTYVGGANGVGSGTCWLKQSMADYPKSGNNVISAVKVAKSNSGVASVGSSSSSVSSSSVASSSSSVTSLASSSSSTSLVVSSSSSATGSTSSSSSAVISSSASSSSGNSASSSSSSVVSSTSSSSSVVSSTSSSVASSTSSSASSSIAPTVTSSASSTSSSTATTFSTSSTSSSSSALSLPTGFSSYGCFVDGSPRALAYSAGSSSTNTPYKCASTCQSLGYKYAGTEYSNECWCSNTAPTSSAKATDCNMACSGDKTQTCGAGNRLSVYVDNTWTQKFSARTKYGTWNLMACYTDNTNGRLLSTSVSMTGGANNATIANCLDACAKSGLRVCGAEYYQECYGSSTTPSSSLIAGSDPLTAGCNYPCTGNSTEACGGSNKILVYINNGTQASGR